MIYLLLQNLNQIGYRIPAAFFFVSTRMVLAAVTSLLIVILLGPRCIKKLYELKTGQDDPCRRLSHAHRIASEERHSFDGGILIIGAIAISSMLWMDWTYSFTWILFLTLMWMGWIGFRDDYFEKLSFKKFLGLCMKKKMLAQITLLGVLCLLSYGPASI